MDPYKAWFPRKRDRLRKTAGGIIAKGLFEAAPALFEMTPYGKPSRYGIERIRNIPYRATGMKQHLLDVYRPEKLKDNAPVVMYIHGGGFRICSKDTHWMFGMEYAKAGYVVFNINYRLAPEHPFPAGLTDAAHAYKWIVEHAHEYGGDVSNLFVAGESAGGNFTSNIALTQAYERDESFLAPIRESEKMPTAILPACAYLDLENDAFHSERDLPQVVLDRMRSITEAYVGRTVWTAKEREIISPLLFLEESPTPVHSLPPTYIACGGGDVIRHDSIRLNKALEDLDVDVKSKLYGNEPHAFHALPFRKNARECWQDQLTFMQDHMS